MKRAFIFLLIILFSAQVFGQKTEFSLQIGSGFFSFRGANAGSSTSYNTLFSNHLAGRAVDPYGRSSGFSFGIALQAQRIIHKHFIYGLQAGYESLSSIIKIDNISTPLMGPYPSISVYNGSKAILTNQFVNLHPFIGARLDILKAINTDVTFGADFGFCTSRKERDIVHTSYGNADEKLSHDKPKVDSRLRVDLINYYKHFGLSVGYSYGLTNYEKGMVGSSPKVYSQMIRLGLVYKF